MTLRNPPNWGELSLVGGAAGLFLLGGILSLARFGRENNRLRLTAKSMAYFGICLAMGGVIWHALNRGRWLPIEDNFEALTVLGVLLVAFSLYMQRAKPLPGLDWFLFPIAIVMLISAVIFGRFRPDAYRADSAWSFTHVFSTFGGAAAFAVAASAGCLYLIASNRLRRKPALSGMRFGSLERLENITDWSVSFGFALLSVGMITGLVKVLQNGSNTQLGAHWMTNPKVVLAFLVWLTYACALHTPLTPAVRGRRSAMLSILGFVLMFGAILAVQFMPNR